MSPRIRKGSLAMVAWVGVVLGASSCSTSVVIRGDNRELLTHAVFIENKGVPAKLLNASRDAYFIDSTRVHRHGFPRDILDAGLKPKLPPYANNYAEQMDSIEAALRLHVEGRLRAGGVPEVLFIIHGGRTTLADNLEDQTFVLRQIGKEFPDVYPIFIKYESEDLSSYSEHLTFSRPARLSSLETTYRIARAPFTFVADLGQGIARIPLNLYQQVEREYSAFTFPELSPPDPAAGKLRFQHFELPLVGPSVKGQTAQMILGLPSLFTRAPIDAITASLGPGVWEAIRRRANVMVTLDHSYIRQLQAGRDQAMAADVAGERETPGAVGRMIELIARVARETPGLETSEGLPVSIVAHSTGAIIACNMVHSRCSQSIQWKDITFLAAACTIRDFENRLRPALERPGPNGLKPRFYNLCLHPIAEYQEFAYPIGFLLRGSLLVWIDDYLAPPGNFLDRTLGRAENALPYMMALPDHVVRQCYLKVFDYGKTTPQKHGGILTPRWAYWRPEFRTPRLRNARDGVANARQEADEAGWASRSSVERGR